MLQITYTANSTSEAVRDQLGRLLAFQSGDSMERHFNLRMPLALFQELARQAAERGMPVGAFIRAQLASNISNPINIHSVSKNKAHAA